MQGYKNAEGFSLNAFKLSQQINFKSYSSFPRLTYWLNCYIKANYYF